MSKVVIIPSDALERLGSSKGGDNYLVRQLVKSLNPKKKPEEGKEKKAEWKFEERIMLWLCFMFAGPIVGMVVMNVMAHLWHDTVSTIQSVPH